MSANSTQIYWKFNHMKPEENILTCPPYLLTLSFSIHNIGLQQLSVASKPLVGYDLGNSCSRAYSRCTLRKPATLKPNDSYVYKYNYCNAKTWYLSIEMFDTTQTNNKTKCQTVQK